MFEHVGRLISFLIRIHLIVTGHYTFEGAVLSRYMAAKVMRLSRKSGLLFTALYLKQCSVALQQYYAESQRNSNPSVMVELSRSGIPTIIPVHHRHIIIKLNARSDYLVKMYLSWFSLCRIIKLASRVDETTFYSIVSEPVKGHRIRLVINLLETAFNQIWPMYMPWLPKYSLYKGIEWKPTFKSTPNDDRRFKTFPGAIGNIFSSLRYEIAAYAGIIRNLKMYSPFGYRSDNSGCLWYQGI